MESHLSAFVNVNTMEDYQPNNQDIVNFTDAGATNSSFGQNGSAVEYDYYAYHYELTDADHLPPDFSHPVKSTLILLYVLIIIVAIIGNSFVILVVVKFNKMRTVTNVFLISLAVSDMLIAGLNMPIQLRFLIQHEWTMGYGMCCFSNYIQGVVIVASILTLTGIAIDR